MNKQKYFEDLDIDPYKTVGVTRKCTKKNLKDAYIKKALVIHPDKTNGETDIEFKLLNECYNYLKDVLDGKIQTNDAPDINATDYKKNFKDETAEKINYTRANLDYNSPENRKKLFVNKGLPLNVSDSRKNLDKIFKREDSYKKDSKYSANDVYREAPQTNIFKGAKFNINQFNAAFELHKETYGCNTGYDAREYTELSGVEFDTSLSPAEIVTYKGLLVEKPQDSYNTLNNLHKSEKYNPNSDDIPTLLQKKEFKKKLKTAKKDKPISEKEFRKLSTKKASEEYKVDTSLTFEEANQKFYEDKVRKMKKEMEDNKLIIEDNLGIYEPAYIEQYRQGLIPDSSTAFFPERDPHMDSFLGKKSIANGNPVSSNFITDSRDPGHRDPRDSHRDPNLFRNSGRPEIVNDSSFIDTRLNTKSNFSSRRSDANSYGDSRFYETPY